MECTSDWKSEYMQLINKNEHAGVASYLWLKTCLHDRSNIAEYGAPSRVGPRANCPSCPPLSAALLITFHDNKAQLRGGSIDLEFNCTFKVDDNSNLTFQDNMAMDGGAIYSVNNCVINFDGVSKILFTKNHALRYGGAMIILQSSHAQITDNSLITFSFNIAEIGGGALYLNSYSKNTITESSVVIFNNNESK